MDCSHFAAAPHLARLRFASSAPCTGILGTIAPWALVSIFDWKGVALDFSDPAHGFAQYFGVYQLALAMMCMGSLGVPFLPAFDPKTALETLALTHGLAVVVGGYRAIKSVPYGLGHASATPLPGSIIATLLCAKAARSL